MVRDAAEVAILQLLTLDVSVSRLRRRSHQFVSEYEQGGDDSHMVE
jgi:hypothetical protein